MKLNDYQTKAMDTCLSYAFNEKYLIAGLSAEAGEVAGKYAKHIRDNTDWDILADDLKKELGDVLWFVAVLAQYCHFSLEEIADTNILKLEGRKERGVLGGSGDNR